jgi:hypothetical protein
MCVCRLLQIVAAHVTEVTQFLQSTPRKRQIFVRACVKLLMSCGSRYKVLLTKREPSFRGAVHKLLIDTETVVLASMLVLPEQHILPSVCTLIGTLDNYYPCIPCASDHCTLHVCRCSSSTPCGRSESAAV